MSWLEGYFEGDGTTSLAARPAKRNERNVFSMELIIRLKPTADRDCSEKR